MENKLPNSDVSDGKPKGQNTENVNTEARGAEEKHKSDAKRTAAEGLAYGDLSSALSGNVLRNDDDSIKNPFDNNKNSESDEKSALLGGIFTLERLQQDERFEQYFRLLSEWNKRFNLTTITSREDVYIKHFLDSVLPSDLFPQGARMLDVGSGAGFPGICLALVRPDLDITLLDSVGKKVNFLDTVISELSLRRTRAVKSRIEDFSLRDFDVVTARAVAHLSTLFEYCLPFLRIGGTAVFYKSADCEKELSESESALRILGGQFKTIVKREVTEGITRTFVIVEKTKPTPPKYPRGGNKPRLSPL